MPQSKQAHDEPDSPENRTTSAAAEPGDGAPYWLPRGDAWRRLSEPIRRAVHQSILPMWKQLVDRAADELERSTAATLVYLTWLEVRGQIELEEARGDSDPLSATLADPERLMAQHLQLLAAKHRVCGLLARLRSAREKPTCRQAAAAGDPPSDLFDRPLGPRRCFPWKSRESRVESRESRADGRARPNRASAAGENGRGAAQRAAAKRARRRGPADLQSGLEDPATRCATGQRKTGNASVEIRASQPISLPRRRTTP